jgi:hypothetical protein
LPKSTGLSRVGLSELLAGYVYLFGCFQTEFVP